MVSAHREGAWVALLQAWPLSLGSSPQLLHPRGHHLPRHGRMCRSGLHPSPLSTHPTACPPALSAICSVSPVLGKVPLSPPLPPPPPPLSQPHLCHPTVSGAWTPWTPWSNCPVSCGGADQVRSRSCTAPTPGPHGAPCSGPSTQTQRCGQQPCQGLLKVCSWGPWGPCSQSCGPGLATRFGSCPCMLAEADPNCTDTFTHLDTQACYLEPCLGECMGRDACWPLFLPWRLQN